MDGTDITVTITPQALSDWFACDFSVTLFKVVHTAKVKVGATVVDPSNTSALRPTAVEGFQPGVRFTTESRHCAKIGLSDHY